jgi:hypothetical protein
VGIALKRKAQSENGTEAEEISVRGLQREMEPATFCRSHGCLVEGDFGQGRIGVEALVRPACD